MGRRQAFFLSDWIFFVALWYHADMSTTLVAGGTEPVTGKQRSTLARRLRNLREAKDLTRQALATAAGLSMSVVAAIEQGRIPDPRSSTLRALATALGVTLDELLPPPTERGAE
jgi:DNA-binding XRE family transcriptional regulator